MGTQGRREDPRVGSASLHEEPYRFDFIQAVRLLHAARGGRAAVGHDAAPGDEAVRFSAMRGLGFPASSIDRLTIEAGRPPLMSVAFLGLTGPSGVLPTHYSELVIEEVGPDEKPGPLADFLDMFHHRLISFYYRGWERNHPHLSSNPEDRATFLGYLLAFLGEPSGVDDPAALDRLRHGGIWAQTRRTAEGLRVLVLDFLQGIEPPSQTPPNVFDAEITPFVPRWIAMEEERQLKLGEGTPGMGLGRGAILGRRARDWQGRFRLRIGPLDAGQFDRLQPPSARVGVSEDGPFRKLTDLVTRYVGPEYDFEVVLAIRADQAPRCGIDPKKRSRLGRTWLLTRTPAEDVEIAFQLRPAEASAHSE